MNKSSPESPAKEQPSADEVPHFWMGHRDKEPSTEEVLRVSDTLVQAVTEDYWKDAVVQWPERFLHTKECNVHEPTLSLCSCCLETRLKDEILRLQRRAPESPAKEQPGEQFAAPQEALADENPKRPQAGSEETMDALAVAAPDVAAMVERLRDESLRLRSSVGWTTQCSLIDDAAALIEKLGQGWIPVSERLPDSTREVELAVQDREGEVYRATGYFKNDWRTSVYDPGGTVFAWHDLMPLPERP